MEEIGLLFLLTQLIININILMAFGVFFLAKMKLWVQLTLLAFLPRVSVQQCTIGDWIQGEEMYYTFSTDRCAHAIASIHGCNSVFSYVHIIICNILPLTQQYHSMLILVVLDLYVSQSTLPCLILFLGI